MTEARANPFGDLDDFQPKPSPKRIEPQVIEELAQQSGFVSREPVSAKPVVPATPALPAAIPPTQQRRYRTGRNAQFNVKAKPETIERLKAVADQLDITVAQVFEMAVDALERERRVQQSGIANG